MFNSKTFVLRTLEGETITVPYNPQTTTVGDIKNGIFHQNEIPVENQQLMFSGKSVSDDTLVTEAGYLKGTTVFLKIQEEQEATHTESVSNYRSPTPTPYVDQVD